MELDDLKQNWRNAAQQHEGPAYDLNDLLMKKVNSPLASLKMKYIRQIVMLPAAALFLITMCIKNPVLRQNRGIGIVVPVLLLLSLIYYRNYRIVVLMQRPSALSVKKIP